MNQYMPKYLKTKNRMMIFDLFRNQNIMSRAELVRITGISFPTVLKIVDKLLELGILIELEETTQSPGADGAAIFFVLIRGHTTPSDSNLKGRSYIWVWSICWEPASTAGQSIFRSRTTRWSSPS